MITERSVTESGPRGSGAFGAFLGTVLAFGPWLHLLGDRGSGTLDAWIDRGLVIISLLGVLVLINRFAPDVLPRIVVLVAAIRSGRVSRTAERRAAPRRKHEKDVEP